MDSDSFLVDYAGLFYVSIVLREFTLKVRIMINKYCAYDSVYITSIKDRPQEWLEVYHNKLA